MSSKTTSHFYTDFIDGVGNFGGNLCILDTRTGKVTDLLPEMEDGIFGRFDLSFDAKRIVFDWKKAPREGFREDGWVLYTRWEYVDKGQLGIKCL